MILRRSQTYLLGLLLGQNGLVLVKILIQSNRQLISIRGFRGFSLKSPAWVARRWLWLGSV